MNWAEKWIVANEFFHEGHHLTCSLKDFFENIKEIPIVVVTSQREDVVQTGAKVPLIVVKKMKDLK